MSEIIIASLPPETLAEMANEAAELAQASMQTAILRAVDCGRYLLAAKAQIPHGQWRSWLGVNFDREARTATRYMQLAVAFDGGNPRLTSETSIRQALRIISEDKADDAIEIHPMLASEPEPELAEIVDESEGTEEPEQEPQERPTVRKVSAESRKIPEAEKPKTPEVTPVLVPEADEMVLYHRVGESYRVADADDVAVAALQLHEPISLVRMAVIDVSPSDAAGVIVELEQCIQWLCRLIGEADAE
jgi:hypothetical protein